MNRIEMVKARTAQLEKLDDIQLVDAVITYFKTNRTLPGQKALKDFALGLKAEFNGTAMTGLLSQVRKDLIEEFASLLVQEVKLVNVRALNENKPNRDKAGTKASDLPMVLKDVQPIPVNNVKNTYEMGAYITGRGVYNEDGLDTGDVFAILPKGFVKNHPGMDGFTGTVLASDHSNGKFANMSYRLLIDLGQTLDNPVTLAA